MAQGWTRHAGLAVALPLEGVDTDQLIPARFMSAPRTQGYGQFLLHDLRRDADGGPRADFPLNRPEAEGASILIARRNFGGGSSREAAVYALADAGFRVVLAPSFGDIFAANAVNNGVLPARLEAARIEELIAAAPLRLTVDLQAGRIDGAPGGALELELDPVQRRKLINGWDDIDVTAAHADQISRFAARRRREMGWMWPADQAGAQG